VSFTSVQGVTGIPDAGSWFAAGWPFNDANSIMIDAVGNGSADLNIWTTGTIPTSPTSAEGTRFIAVGRWY
jgi:hypothetical protein